MTPTDYELIEQGYDPPRMTYSNERVEEIVAELEAVMEGLPPSQPDASAGLSDDEKRLVLKLPIVRALIASWRERGQAMTEPSVEEIVARCEMYEYSLPRDEQRALIASWRERADENRRLREALLEASGEADMAESRYQSAVRGRADFRDAYRKAREAIIEARRRLAKGRALWNGPCHECDAVLASALAAESASAEAK